MSSTSDSRVDTGDRDPYDAEPVRNDPWATGPAHSTQDDQTERFVPGQRDADHDGHPDRDGHDGHLYASDTYAEPETTVLPGATAHDAQGKGVTSTQPADPDATVVVSPEGHLQSVHSPAGHHDDEPTAVGVAHVGTDRSDDTDRDHKHADHADHAEHGDHGDHHDKADRAADRADEAKAEAEEVKAEAEEARADGSHTRHEHEVETVALPPAEPVAIVEPVEDRPGDFAAVPVAVPVEDRAGTTGHGADTSTDMKPGDVPVEPVTGFFSADAAQGLRDRWREAQLGFIDDPRKTVDDVKALVGEAVDQFTAAVSAQRDQLEAAGDDTEQYRVAVQRYRSFFDRLLGL
jgi:hypothetical protein